MPKRKLMLILGYPGVGLLGILILAMLFPIVRQESFALCTPDSSAEECMAMPMSTEVGVTTSTVISLALDSQVQMEVVPKANGATSYASTKLAVATNSNDGYAIYMQTGSESGNLTGVTSNLDGEISNTAKNSVTLDNLENNAYGYALSKTVVNESTTYSHVPTASTVVESTTNSAVSGGEYSYGDTYYLAFGTKVGTNLPAGQYAGTVTVSAVANPTTLRSMYDLTYMQDMTSDICENTKEHYTKQLIDTRDGKSYWVAKLKDGNCWMTQNLALTITPEMINNGSINSTNTDIAFTWGNTAAWNNLESWKALGENYTEKNYPSKYIAPTATEYDIPLPGTQNNQSTRSWHLGEIILTNPTASKICPEQTPPTIEGITYSKADRYDSAYTGQNIAENCPEYFQDVTNMLPNFTSTPTESVNGSSYDSHYLIGNFYQGITATAGTGVGVLSPSSAKSNPDDLVNAAGSICPKGWHLPKSGLNSDTNSPDYRQAYDTYGSFYRLMNKYGYTDFVSESSFLNIIADINPSYKPFYFVRPGNINISNGSLRWAGNSGTNWSSTASTSSNYMSYHFDLNPTQVNPSSNNSHWLGFSVRCLAY